MFPPIALPTTALDGEQVLLQSRCRYVLITPSGWGYNSITGDLTLTNQRLVFKPDAAAFSGSASITLGGLCRSRWVLTR